MPDLDNTVPAAVLDLSAALASPGVTNLKAACETLAEADPAWSQHANAMVHLIQRLAWAADASLAAQGPGPVI